LIIKSTYELISFKSNTFTGEWLYLVIMLRTPIGTPFFIKCISVTSVVLPFQTSNWIELFLYAASFKIFNINGSIIILCQEVSAIVIIGPFLISSIESSFVISGWFFVSIASAKSGLIPFDDVLAPFKSNSSCTVPIPQKLILIFLSFNYFITSFSITIPALLLNDFHSNLYFGFRPSKNRYAYSSSFSFSSWTISLEMIHFLEDIFQVHGFCPIWPYFGAFFG